MSVRVRPKRMTFAKRMSTCVRRSSANSRCSLSVRSIVDCPEASDPGRREAAHAHDDREFGTCQLALMAELAVCDRTVALTSTSIFGMV